MNKAKRIDRTDFLDNYWPGLYESGQHVLLCGATQRSGKTYLGFQLLESTPDSVGTKIAFAPKPKDKTVAGWSDKLGFREVKTWPPKKKLFDQEPNGYTLWPSHTFDVAKDDNHHREVFRAGMLDSYKHGSTILFVDEAYRLSELNLDKELNGILTRGAGMGCAAWICTQRGSGTQHASLPGSIWSQPYHVFLAHSQNKADRKKYADMNGDFDPEWIESAVLSLPQYNFLYLNAEGSAAIIGR
jgi:hypothetical protein